MQIQDFLANTTDPKPVIAKYIRHRPGISAPNWSAHVHPKSSISAPGSLAVDIIMHLYYDQFELTNEICQ